jgi:hypothetical protein
MKQSITYNWGDQHLLIQLGNRLSPRIKILFGAEFLFTSGMATVFLLQARLLGPGIINWFSYVGAACLYIVASYRFVSRMFSREKLLLDPDGIVIINSTPFIKTVARYEWKSIGPLHYIGKTSKTDHPLKGNCYDYFGFETQEHLIHALHYDGNMYFNYNGLSVSFAKGVYSWDAEEVVHMMKIFAGSKLRLGPEWEQMAEQSA